MMRGHFISTAVLLTIVIATGGCQQTDNHPTADATAATNASGGNQPLPAASEMTLAETDADSNRATTTEEQDAGTDAPESAAEADPSESFQPPFPHRTDFFAPPGRQQQVASRSIRNDESVELQGFANVRGLKAVLAIDGVIAPISQGGERFGIQVITIDPPHVVLQRGRERWTATLDN